MRTLVVFIFGFIYLTVHAKRTPVSIEKAVKTGIVKLEAKGKGGHSGNCVQMKITNKGNDSLYVLLEAGRRLNSVNDEEQDILVTKELIVRLRANETRNVQVIGYCCQASNHSPKQESKFSVGKMADSSLVALAKFCNENKFSEGDVQSSVWCLSDNHSVAGIPGSNEKLRKFVAGIKKEEIPWYQKDYEAASGQRTFSDRANKISGSISYTTLTDNYMNIQLRDANGHLVQKFTNNKLIPKGNYDYWFELQVTNWPKGKYFIHIYSGEQLLTKKEFVI